MSNSELRKDIVSGEWVVIAPKRGKRPHDFVSKQKRKRAPKRGCPFEDPQKTNHEAPILIYPKDKPNEWKLQIIRNKYPAFTHEEGKCVSKRKEGLYEVRDGVGYAHLLITRDHDKRFFQFSKEEMGEVLLALREHYQDLLLDECVEYISMFHNWGPKAGASIYHPHMQIMAIPVIPPDVGKSLVGSDRYYRSHRKCVHCAVVRWEIGKKKRILYQSRDVVAFAPYVSREPFEFRIFPRKHSPYFEDEKTHILKEVADVLRRLLSQVEKKLHDPDLNFFIHSAPVKNKKKHAHYHWHVEALPKLSISAGFELGTGIEVTVVDPDEAATLLRIKK